MTNLDVMKRPWAPWWQSAVVVATLGCFLIAVGGLAHRSPSYFGVYLAAGVFMLVAAIIGLMDRRVALVFLMISAFVRLGLPEILHVDPFLLAFGGMVVAVLIWMRRRPHVAVPVGSLEVLVGLYVAWNVGSMLAPHVYGPVYPQDGTSLSVPRFLLIGTVMPLMLMLLARQAYRDERALRAALFVLLVTGAYSTYVSIMGFQAPGLVWPRNAVAGSQWPGRAVGILNNPSVNGLVLILGYLAGLLLAFRSREHRVVKVVAALVSVGCIYGVYLTHTRSAWLSMAIVVLAGAALARGWRTGFVVTALGSVGVVIANWATFSTSDRAAGGVGSTSELEDRLNLIATAWWGLREKPLLGWGLGRFPAVNTYHHQQWSPSIPWERGYGIASHVDFLGVAVELGLIGLLLWGLVMTVAVRRLATASRVLPDDGAYGNSFAVLAILALIAQQVTGLAVDLRFFDFTNLAVYLLVGMALGRGEPPVPSAARRTSLVDARAG